MELSTEVCVIGSGAGGAALATELALAGVKVVVLEAGTAAPKATLGEPAPKSAARAVGRGAFSLALARGLPPMLALHGRCEGGGTTINNGNAFRLPAHIQAEWCAAGVPELRDYFDRVDTFLKVAPCDDSLLGTGGARMLAGLRTLGWRGGPMPRNAPLCSGRNVCHFGCPEEAKRQSTLSYLPVAREHGAQVLLRTPALKIAFKGRRAVGVEARSADGTALSVRADRVVASGGALFTPALLQRSGVDAPELGRNLLLHPDCLLAADFGAPQHGGEPRVSQSTYCDEFLESEGFLFINMALEEHVGLAALAATGSLQSLRRRRDTSFWAALVHDEPGAGEVGAAPGGGYTFRYNAGPVENRRLRRAFVRMAELAFAAGARAVTPVFPGAPRAASLRALERALPEPLPKVRLIGASFHQMGSCGIGRTCEPDGRVRGYENLYVADSSLFPTASGVTPQMPTMALATHVAANMLQAVS